MAKELEFTGERFVPSIKGKIEIEHLHRYIFATDYVVDKVVLDIASGEGYGASILSFYAKEVIGVDIETAAVKHALKKYRKDNLRFLQGSCTNIPLDDNSVDVVVSFETIEHITDHDQMISEIKRVLKKDGILILSTPNIDNYQTTEGGNAYHLKELNYQEFKDMLETNFKHNQFYGQNLQYNSCIVPFDKSSKLSYTEYSDGDYFKMLSSKSSKFLNAEYFISVSSEGLLNEYYSGILSQPIQFAEEITHLTSSIAELTTEIHNKAAWIEQLIDSERKLLQEKDNFIDKIDEISSDLANKTAWIEQLLESERTLKALLENSIEVEASLLDKDKKISALSDESDNLRKQNKNDKAEIERLQTHYDWSWEHIASLENKATYFENNLSKIYASSGWRFLLIYYRIASILFPSRSFRRRIVDAIFGILRLFYKALRYLYYNGIFRFTVRCFSYPYEKFKALLYNRRMGDTFDESVPKYIELPKPQKPLISIIIPVYNQYAYTMRCLESIRLNSGDITYEVILADDKSTDKTRKIKKNVKNLNIIRNSKNLKFLLNCNKAAKSAKGKYIVFLNNDTLVQPNWLSPLIDLMEKDSAIGMTGSKLIYPDGKLQEAGGVIWKDASGWNYGNGCDPESSEYNYVKDVDYISGASIAISRKLWNEIGGFDERYFPAYYEDTDLAFEVRKRGYRVVYQPLSVVIHFEGVSNGKELNSGLKSYQIANQEKFYNKWKDVLEKDHFTNAENIFYARDRSRYKKTLVLVDHYVPHYDKDAGSRNIFEYLRLFVDMGYHIIFIGDNFARHEPYTTALQQLGIEVLYGEYYYQFYNEWIIKNKEYIDFVIIQRPHIGQKYIDLFKANTCAKIIYSLVDLHYVRLEREYILTKQEDSMIASIYWKEIELNLIAKSDITITLSSYEKEVLKSEGYDDKVYVTPMFFYKDLDKIIIEALKKENILFVGGFGHTPNEDGVLWFIDNVWHLVKEVLPTCKFYIVGSNPTDKIKSLASDDIIVTGYVTDEELQAYYINCSIAIVPLRYGAGVKGKLLEAMSSRVGVVSTSIGIEGLQDIDNYLPPCDDPKVFAERIIELYTNDDALVANINNCIEYLKKYLSYEHGTAVFREILS